MKRKRVSIDTRTIQPGDAFIAVGDGHQYCDDAIAKGATVLDTDLESYAIAHRKKYMGMVIGITGSFGKTTLKNSITAMLKPLGVSATEKNFNNEIGVPLTIANAHLDTPYWVVEMGIRKPGDMARLQAIVQPDIAVLSGIGHSHMAFFDSPTHLLTEKLGLLCPTTKDLFYPSTIPDPTPHMPSPPHCHPVPIARLIDTNTAICHALGSHLGIPTEIINAQLQTVQPSPHRLSTHTLPNGATLIDDTYNANPTAVRFAVAHTLENYTGPITVILGTMGELGTDEISLHADTVSWVLAQERVTALVTYGALWPAPVDANHTHVNHTDTLTNTLSNTVSNQQPPATFLIKGSRMAQLDKVVQALLPQ
jgi:UDP-N-acetylmuramoyl-tripeptide--D-alanyl-D-alanine ligase